MAEAGTSSSREAYSGVRRIRMREPRGVTPQELGETAVAGQDDAEQRARVELGADQTSAAR